MLRLRTLHTPLAALLALVGALLLPALPAHAQILTQVLSFDGRTTVDLTDLATQMGTPLNLNECSSGAEITWRFTQVDSNRANLSFFSGTSCDDANVRTDTTNTSCTDLELGVAIEGLSQVDFTTRVDELIDCSAGAVSGIDTIWVLALDQPASEVAGAGQSTSFPLAYDFVGPSQPTGLEASNGEAGTQLTWTSAGTNVLEYEVYRIAGGCTNGLATVDPATAAPLATTDGNASTYDVLFPEEDPIGTEYALAVRALDQSMNPSEISTVRCVQKIQVDSFFEMFCADGSSSADACTGGGECTVSPGQRSAATAGWLMLLGLGALVFRRLR